MICAACQENLSEVYGLFVLLRWRHYMDKKLTLENIREVTHNKNDTEVSIDNLWNFVLPTKCENMRKPISEIFEMLNIENPCCRMQLSAIEFEPTSSTVAQGLFRLG